MEAAGPLAFTGGGEWQPGCDFDVDLLKASGAGEVLIVPTAAAYEHPDRVVGRAEAWFASLGATTRKLPVLERQEAEDAANADLVRSARFIYLSDGSALHVRSVLKDSLTWTALQEAWQGGAVVAGSSAGAMILSDPMIDPRGGAFTLGLGLIRNVAVVPHWERWSEDRTWRMTHLIPSGVAVAEIDERTALVRHPDGNWEAKGAGRVRLRIKGEDLQVSDLKALLEG